MRFIRYGSNLAAALAVLAVGLLATNFGGSQGTSGAITQAYETVQDEGSGLTQRSTLNAVGAGVTCADSGGKTVCTIPGVAVEDEGSGVTYRAVLNFVGAGVSVADVAAKTTITIPGATTPFSDWQSKGASIPLVDNSTDTTIYTTTVTAGALAAGKCLNVEAWYQHTTGTGGVTSKIFFGATEAILQTSNTDTTLWYSRAQWCNNVGATNAQQLTLWPTAYQRAVAFTPTTAASVTTSAIDTTAAVVIKLTGRGANTEAMTGNAWRIWVTP